MHPSSRLVGVAAVVFAVCLSCCVPALASASSSVIVRVEGEAHTLVGPVSLSGPEHPVSAPGDNVHSCPGNSALGALALAAGGEWGGSWFESYGYSIESVAGESHVFGSGSFWDIWFQHSEASLGLCEIVEPEPGSEVLLFPCPEAGPCPGPLGITAPTSANVGEAVTVHVVSYSPSGEATPAAGASVTGAAAPATTAADGSATVTFSAPGQATLAVNAPNSVRDETQVCVHAGNDGTCGTSSPGSSNGPSGKGRSGTAGTTTNEAATNGASRALGAKVSSVHDGATYRRSSAPRLLAGTISAPDAVTSVSLKLRRSYRGRCYFYDAPRARFVHSRCGRGRSFRVSSSASFSYLLPKRLAPGRYVLEVSALDAAGNHTTPTRGASTLVFRVR